MTPESWRQIPGYEGIYDVSDMGRIWAHPRIDNLGRSYAGRIRKPHENRDGHLALSLTRDGKHVTRYVHHLVLEAFRGDRPEGTITRHLDGDPANNRASNLTWGTHSENNYDQVRHGTHPRLLKTACPHGHPYVPENLSPHALKDGYRACKACERGSTPDGFSKERADRAFERIMLGDPKRTDCLLGHELVPENQRINGSCKACQRGQSMARRRGVEFDREFADYHYNLILNPSIEGSRDGRKKLTEAQRKAIRSEYAKGDISQAALGDKYNVTQGAIFKVVNTNLSALRTLNEGKK